MSLLPPSPVALVDVEILGRKAWRSSNLTPADWTVELTQAAIAELTTATRRIDLHNDSVEALRPESFELRACYEVMAQVRERLVNGCGLAVVNRVPVERFTVEQNRAIGWLLACALGQVVDQKWTGTRIYDVKDSGQKLEYGVRRSVTNLGQPFHTDGGWLYKTPAFVGLFCLESAPNGGMSRFTSLVTAHNEMRRQHRDLLARLYGPFAWDRQAEHAPDDSRFAWRPLFENSGGVLAARYYDDYVVNGYRLADEAMDAIGRDAIAALAEIVNRPDHWVEFRVESGQFQYINNRQFAHCRTAFEDASDGSQLRHMLRIWNRDDGSVDLESRAQSEAAH